jgi:diaminohydroxyphosphoribosylaminopyrimidine deaminase / 5-amino-6-(5-phosphoribosylamino)uracil reductase
VNLSALDLARLQDALELAERSIGLSDPNPRVGCVIGLDDGTVLGQGHTQRAGEPHAEAMALRDVGSRGTRGATAWVTLEPCSHHGRTPPCTEALIDAGIQRVVVAETDPFPLVNGRGIECLRAAGIRVDVAEGAIARAARQMNVGFFSRIERGRPWLRMKIAASLDGRTALPNGQSQWITGELARQDGHRWRRRAGALLSGIGTVLHDDPRLDVRLVDTVLQPLRVIVDSEWRTPSSARLFDGEGGLLVVGAIDHPRRKALESRGAQTLLLPNALGQVDLPAVLLALAECEINEVHLEAGPVLNGAWLETGLVDEWLLYVAPRVFGDGAGMARIEAPSFIDDATRMRITDVALIGGDLRMLVRPLGQSQPDRRVGEVDRSLGST